jgi:hypothetical protein
MAAQVTQLGNLSDQHANQRESVISQLIKALLALWQDPGSWYDSNLIAGQAARSAQLVSSAQARTRTLTRSYANTLLKTLDAAPSKLPPIVSYYPRSGVTPLQVYSRPAVQFAYARSQGASVQEAHEVANQRLQDLAHSDVMLAERDEFQKVYKAAPKVIGYRRVIHPELSRSGTCGLCAVAATRFYKTGDLLPLHNLCDCDTMPVTEGDDPGFRLNDDDLKKIYAAAGDTTQGDFLKEVRISIDEHGELGPILVRQGQEFRSAKDVGRPAWVKPTPESIRAGQQAAQADTVEKLAAAQAALDAFDGKASDRVPLFRAVKYLQDLQTAQAAALKQRTT